jgi:hypothetical protein
MLLGSKYKYLKIDGFFVLLSNIWFQILNFDYIYGNYT